MEKLLNKTLSGLKKSLKNDKRTSSLIFIPHSCMGQVAKLIQIYLEKGDLVGLTGHYSIKVLSKQRRRKRFL